MKVDPRLCVLCRGRGYCGLAYCPIIAKNSALSKLKPLRSSREVFGSSPPSVFVGRTGYPRVRIGPSSPPLSGDTQIYEFPESWLKMRLEDVLEYRFSLVTGYVYANVKDASGRNVDAFKEIAMSIRPVDIEMKLQKPPIPRVLLDDEQPPFGPSSPLESLRLAGNAKIPKKVDELYEEGIKAREAVVELYKSGFPVSYIQKIMSVGALGAPGSRKLVPTRWSITAVDSTISEDLVEEIKSFDEIEEIEVYAQELHDNLYISILFPRAWSFEWMEAWWPGSTWNAQSEEVVVEGDNEGYYGRKTYPSIGGCYYSARLATAEHLLRKRRQASAVLLREIYPGFNIPIGVWFVRESIRDMYRKGPIFRTTNFKEVLAFLDNKTKLGSAKWLSSSKLMKLIIAERKITEYFGDSPR